MLIRKAIVGDVDEIAFLAASKRKQYEKFQPEFHKEAPDALKNHTEFLKASFEKENIVILVGENESKKIEGFVIGSLVSAPPVYAPGGKIFFVDDFMVRDSNLWPTLGKEMLEKAIQRGREKGAVLANVVCGPRDLPKKEMLEKIGFDIASEWNVKSIR